MAFSNARSVPAPETSTAASQLYCGGRNLKRIGSRPACLCRRAIPAPQQWKAISNEFKTGCPSTSARTGYLLSHPSENVS